MSDSYIVCGHETPEQKRFWEALRLKTERITALEQDNARLRAAATALLDFVKSRYPADFLPGGPGFSCPYHRELDAAVKQQTEKKENQS
jgi:hypothetical protein